MATPIESVAVREDRFNELYGLEFHDYKLNGVKVDLQDLAVSIAQQRATAIEDEVKPLQELITRRNDRLEKYGNVLAVLTQLQAMYADKNKDGSVSIGNIPEAEFAAIMEEIGYPGCVKDGQVSLGKAQVDGAVQRAKTKIDAMNNDSQKDMTRLQAVVDRRDESFSTATSLMTNISDTRGTLIRNL